METKRAVPEEAEREGTSRKPDKTASQVHNWKNKLQVLGAAGLSGTVRKADPENHRLRLENQAFRQMLAEQA